MASANSNGTSNGISIDLSDGRFRKKRESRRSSRIVDDDADLLPPDRVFLQVASSARSVNTVSTGNDEVPKAKEPPKRMVVVRYFLDRPGYGLHNSVGRLWFDPPEVCTPTDVHLFLREQGIALDGLLIEVYLDKFESFMMLEACEASLVEWNFEDTTYHDPGILNIRLTDLIHADSEAQGLPGGQGAPPPKQQQSQMANTIPAGLLSFSMMVGLETTALMGKMFPGTVSVSYTLAWGPYMFFVGGLLQILVGITQVLRNNIYGAIAFLGFGSFWFSNGTIVILEKFFAVEGSIAEEVVEVADPVGSFIRVLFVFAFSCVLLKQTLVMNKLSTTLIGLLCFKLAFQGLGLWVIACQYGQLIFGWVTSIFAFYVFTTEFTNAVYHREVFPVFKWSEKTSPEEVFGAAGRTGTLHSKAAKLRRASYPTRYRVRSASVDSTRTKRD